MFRKGCLGIVVAVIVIGATPFFWREIVQRYYGRYITTVADAPSERVAIVFGAAVYGNGRLSTVLRDRVETAIALYERGAVDKIIMSGDNSSPNYNEPGAMMAYAVARGVPEADIQPDYGGFRTYDSCYRAHHIFGLESAILVTQAFHLPRAIFTCQALGVDAVGVAADQRPYRGAEWYETRETAASFVALVDVIRRQPATVMGAPIVVE